MKKLSVLFVALLSLGAAQARATPVTLTFTGLQDLEPINNYYNGGSGGFGTTGGTNYGISFSSDSLAVISVLNGGSGNFSDVPPPASSTIAFFLSGAGDTMNVAGGFDTGFSFDYAAIAQAGSVDVFSGLNGTGSLLATLVLPANGGYCGVQAYSCWSEIGVAFAGTAQSVVFGGSANFIGFANVTLGSDVIPPTNPVPEPSSLMLLGTGLAAAAGVVRRRIQA